MSDSNPPPPPPPPPSPQTITDALADALHVDDPSAVRPRLHGAVGTVLFGVNQPTSAVTADLTPLPQHKRSAPPNRSGSTSSKARKLQTPTSTPSAPAAVINRQDCLTNELFAWSRAPLLNLLVDIASNDDDFSAFETQFLGSITQRFKDERETKSKFLQSLSSQPRSTRSTVSAPVAEVDEEAMNLTTSDPRRLSRLHWEDIIRCKTGQSLKLYVTKDAALSTKGWWHDTFIDVLRELKTKTINFNRTVMYCFDVIIQYAPLHDSIFKGDVSLSQLQTLFNQGDGFSVFFVGTKDIKLSISWKKMLHSSDELLIFGSPLPRNRLYSRYLHGKETITSLRMAFHQAAKETAGDYSASSALMLAFQKEEKKLLKAMTK